MFEVFDPSNGRPIFVTRWRWLARLLARLLHGRCPGGLDYERAGRGWTRPEGMMAIPTFDDLNASAERLSAIMDRLSAIMMRVDAAARG